MKNKDSVSGKAFDTKLFLRLMQYAKPYKSAFRLGLFLTIVLALLAPLRPILIQHTVDNTILTPDSDGLLNMTLLILGLLILESLIQFYNTYLTNWMGQSVIRDLRLKVYAHITRFKLKYFDNTPIGTLVTRAVSDIETIAEVFSQGILVIIGDILQLVVVIIAMFIIDWRLSIISLASLPLLIATTYVFKKAIKIAFQDVRTQVARLNAFVQEHITGMSIIQIFNREESALAKFSGINTEHKNAHVRTVWIFSIFFPVVEILSAVSLGLLVWWGSKGVLQGLVTLGDLFAFILYIFMLFRPIRQLADRFTTLQMGMVGSERCLGCRSGGQLGDVRDAVHQSVQLSQQRQAVIAQRGVVGHHHHAVKEGVDRFAQTGARVEVVTDAIRQLNDASMQRFFAELESAGGALVTSDTLLR